MTGQSPMSYTPSGAFSIPGSSPLSNSNNNTASSSLFRTIETGATSLLSSMPSNNNSNNSSLPTPPKPLFKTVDTTTSRSSNNMFSSTASSSSSIPSSLQPKQNFHFNSMPNIATGSQQKPPHRAVSWSTPPTFFVTSKSNDNLNAMDTEPTESYNVAFGEGKSIMSLNDTEVMNDPKLVCDDIHVIYNLFLGSRKICRKQT